MLHSLRCENFKCFRDTEEVEIAPITILVGENNSGKSSIIQALHLPALTLQSEDPGICLKLVHTDYDYGTYKDIVFQHDEKSFVTMGFGAVVEVEKLKGEKIISETAEFTVRLTYGYLLKRKEIYLERFVIEDSKGERLNIHQDKYTRSKKVLMRDYEDEMKYLARLIERRGPFFKPRFDPITTFTRLQGKYGEKKAKKMFLAMYTNEQIVQGFTSSFRNVHFIGPLRNPARRSSPYTGELTEKVGPKGERALQNYATLLKRRRKEARERIKSINNALYQLGFVKDLDMQQIGARDYELWTQHKESLLRANLADTGFGASQVLPVIVTLYTSPTGSTLLLEQPEIHLHPAAQAELGSVFVEASSKDKRFVIETHSENLILRIQTEVAKGKLTPEDVRIYYIKPDRAGHKVIHIRLNEKGQFLDQWPKGFFEENYQESLKLSKARHSN